MNVDEWVALSVKHNASDLHLCSGHPPMLRIDGQLRSENTLPRLCTEQLEQWCAAWLEQPLLRQLQRSGQVDCALMPADGPRLRVNLFRQRQGLSAALRIIPSTHPSLTTLRAPPSLSELIEQPDGLILLTGATGSGKSTTLAAMIAALNQRRRRHVITLEDPIEFIHTSGQCLIQQREIGRDSTSLPWRCGRAASDPDVILLGNCAIAKPSAWR